MYFVQPNPRDVAGFNSAARNVSSMLERLREVNAVKGRPLGLVERLDKTGIEHQLDTILKVRPVMPTELDIMGQLINNDAVHKFGVRNMRELTSYRVGKMGDNKMAIAITNPYGNLQHKEEVLGIIYVYLHTGPITCDADLPANVEDILKMPCKPLDGPITCAIFYSISNINLPGTPIPLLKGSGERLVDGVFPIIQGLPPECLAPGARASTLSPLRTLCKAYPGINLFGLSESELILAVYEYLKTGHNPVEKFHVLGNGARIGRICLNANGRDSDDWKDGAGVMINYHYDLDKSVREANRALAKAGQYDRLFAQEQLVEILRLMGGQHAHHMPQLAARVK